MPDKQCEFCNNPEKYIGVSDYEDTRLFIGLSGSYLRIFDEEYPGFTDMFEIEYCPKCGRKLKD